MKNQIYALIPTSNSRVKALSLLVGFILINFSCGKQEQTESRNVAVLNKKGLATVSTTLPGGRANYTVVIGRFQSSPGTACWVRLLDWHFNTDGTVHGTYSQWSSTSEFGKTLLNSHTCSVDPTAPTKTCSQYAPTGWIVGTAANPRWSWDGTYTYDPVTGALHIDWPTVNNAWENWTVSAVPGKSISKLSYVSSSANYSITHGLGYGSNAAWGTYKTITEVPRIDASSVYAACTYNGTASTYTVTNWVTTTIGLSALGSATGGTNLHMKLPSGENSCQSGCCSPATGYTGNIYHLAALNTSATARKMIWNHHCACLPCLSEYPCYSGTIHPYAMMQVIDDAGAMQGMIGIHAQDQPNSPGFNYSINAMMYP